MAAKGSLVADQLLRALSLRMKLRQVSPLTTLHIEGKKNAMTDIPSRSFGSEPKWFCKDDTELLTLFNKTFPIPQQNSWTAFQPSSAICMRVISVLRTSENTLAALESLCRTSSSGPLLTGNPILQKGPMPHWLCRTGQKRQIWQRPKSQS